MQIRQPNRITRTYTQRLVGNPAAVFPLLCPVRECDWIEGWNPIDVISSSGVAEADCIFVTEAQPVNAIWFITRHEAENGFVEMVKVSPSVTVCKISIQLTPVSTGSKARVTYTHTSLGPEGNAFIENFSDSYFQQFMREWETRLNHYLATGKILASA